MSTVLSDSKTGQLLQEEVFSAENLALMDETVKEVFGMMLNIEITSGGEVKDGSEEPARHDQTAIVGFAGAMSGICEISMSNGGSLAIASAMMGGMEVELGSDVCDAMGELCNMLAGAWKNRVPGLGAACSLSVPTVIEGTSYVVHRPTNAKLNRRAYGFGADNTLLLTLLYDPN